MRYLHVKRKRDGTGVKIGSLEEAGELSLDFFKKSFNINYSSMYIQIDVFLKSVLFQLSIFMRYKSLKSNAALPGITKMNTRWNWGSPIKARNRFKNWRPSISFKIWHKKTTPPIINSYEKNEKISTRIITWKTTLFYIFDELRSIETSQTQQGQHNKISYKNTPSLNYCHSFDVSLAHVSMYNFTSPQHTKKTSQFIVPVCRSRKKVPYFRVSFVKITCAAKIPQHNRQVH